MSLLTRREFGLLSLGMLLPRAVLAGASRASSRQKFLFVFCEGGWDPGYVFTPLDHVSGAGYEADATFAEANGLAFVDHADREPVRNFFENYGDRTAIINGLEVRSVAHAACRRLWMTSRGSGGDDWPSILGGHADEGVLMPHLILDGPAYTEQYTHNIVRVGDSGQLPSLLSGLLWTDSEGALPVPSDAARMSEHAFLSARSIERGTSLGTAYANALERVAALAGQDDIDLEGQFSDCERDITADCRVAFECFSRELSRCAMVRYKGWCAEGWDTHSNIFRQSINFHDLFSYLGEVMVELAALTSSSGGSLADEVTIVVFSEMGREPKYNSWGGKDHWTFTSAMLVGAGIQGGQVIGALDDQGQGLPIDLASGDLSEKGTALLPEHLGATLLALGDVDSVPYLGDAQVIEALLQ